MSCEINEIGSINGNISIIRRCLFPTDDRRGSDNWLQQCKISACPTGACIAFANGRRLVVLKAKSNYSPPDSEFDFVMSFSGNIHEYDKVKAILCLPVAYEQSGHIFPDWTCIVIGYDSGYVRFYTENCELLLEDQFHNENITNIKCQSQHAPRPDLCQELHTEEIFVQYKSALCVLSGSELFGHLRTLRNGFNKVSIELPNISVKKWGFSDQSLINDSVVVGLNLANTFDHLLAASTYGGFDTKYRSVPPHNTLVLAAGSRPFLGYHYAIEGVNQPVFSDVAKVVATRLKSALPGWLTTNTNQQEKQKTIAMQPVEGMTCRFGLCDLHRTGNDIILTPNHKLAVISDSLGRVILLDTYRGVVLKIFKGYREAQCAVVPIPDERKSKHKLGNKVAHFLVIYSPKKATIEIFTLQTGQRIATFSASKYSRLLSVDYNLMGLTSITKSKFVCRFTTIFIDSDGIIKEILIPFHFALEENSSKRVRDIHLYRKFREIIRTADFNIVEVDNDLYKVYKELQTIEIKNQIIDLMLNSKEVSCKIFLRCIEYFLENIDSDQESANSRNFKTLCTNISLLLKLYKFIEVSVANKIENEENGNGEKKSDNTLSLTSKELANLQKLLDLNAASDNSGKNGFHVRFSGDSSDYNRMSASNFIATFIISNEGCLSLKSDIDDILLFRTAEVLYKPYIKGELLNFDDLQQKLIDSKIPTRDLMFLLINYWVDRSIDVNLNLEKEMANLCKLIQTLVKTAQKDLVTTEYSSISKFWSEIRKILANTAKPFPALMAAILCKSVAELIESESFVGEEENIEILSQENVEWSILIGKLEDISLLNIILSIKSIVKNNSLPILKYDKQDISLKFVLEKGKGVVSELGAQWLASCGINPDFIIINEVIFNNNSKIENPEDSNICEGMYLDKIEHVKSEPVFEYLNILKTQFPYSLEASTLLANMCWEYSLAWQKDIEILSNLEAAIKCLQYIKNIRIKCGMYQLVWNAHLKIIIEGACKLINKVGKLPKEKLCRQDTGLSDSQISAFIVICTEFLDEFIDVAQSCCDAPLVDLQFEQLWENEGHALVELAAQQKEVDYNLIHLHYQLTLVLQMITKFSIKHSKPVNNLFEASVVSLFFTDMQRKAQLNLNRPDSKITTSRTQFLSKVILASLETVTINEENQIYCSEHVNWMSKCLTLARIWSVDVDMLKRYQIVQLFATGFDLIGEELISAIRDTNALGLELLVVTAKRLSQFMSTSPDLSQNIAAISPTLTRYMESLDNGQWFAPSSLNSISNLASHVLRCLDESKSQKEYKLAELLAEACSNLEEINV